MTDFGALLSALTTNKIDFIVVGGAAAIAHGSARLTQDLDIVYSRAPENLGRLAAALAEAEPYLRGAPPGLPFLWDRETLRRGFNFTLITNLGDIDLLAEIPGGGSWDDLHADAIRLDLFASQVLCLSLDQLIRAKTAAGRPKDLEAVAELKAIRELSS